MNLNKLELHRKREIVFLDGMLKECLELMSKYYSAGFLFALKCQIEDKTVEMSIEQLSENLELIETEIPNFFKNP